MRTTTMKTGIDVSPQPSTSNSIDVSAKMQTVEQIADVPICDDDTNASMRKAIENDPAQMKSDIASSDAKLTAANVRKRRQTTASLRPSWWKWRTRLKRAIFQLTEREGDQSPVSSKRHKLCCARPRVTPKGLRVLWCERSVNGLCCTVCSSHSVVHLLFLAA